MEMEKNKDKIDFYAAANDLICVLERRKSNLDGGFRIFWTTASDNQYLTDVPERESTFPLYCSFALFRERYEDATGETLEQLLERVEEYYSRENTNYLQRSLAANDNPTDDVFVVLLAPVLEEIYTHVLGKNKVVSVQYARERLNEFWQLWRIVQDVVDIPPTDADVGLKLEELTVAIREFLKQRYHHQPYTDEVDKLLFVAYSVQGFYRRTQNQKSLRREVWRWCRQYTLTACKEIHAEMQRIGEDLTKPR